MTTNGTQTRADGAKRAMLESRIASYTRIRDTHQRVADDFNARITAAQTELAALPAATPAPPA